MAESSEPAVRVRTILDGRRPAPDAASEPFHMQIWVDLDGAIARITFATLGVPEFDADLRGLIVGRKLSSPPANLPMPIRYVFVLEPSAS